MTRTRLLLADDHILFIDGLLHLLGQKFEVVGTALDGRGLVESARKVKPDVVVADISMPELNGLDAARIIRRELITTRMIFLTMHTDLPIVEEAFRAGASGYILKVCGFDECVSAIQCVARGGTYITPLLAGGLISTLLTPTGEPGGKRRDLTLRQREVLQLLAEGKTMKQVAARLGISTRTTESHKYEIMRQLGIRTTAELVQYAVRAKMV